MTVVVRSLNGCPSASVPDTVIGIACTMRVLRRFCVPGSLDGSDSVTISPGESTSKGSIPALPWPIGKCSCAKGLLGPEGQSVVMPPFRVAHPSRSWKGGDFDLAVASVHVVIPTEARCLRADEGSLFEPNFLHSRTGRRR